MQNIRTITTKDRTKNTVSTLLEKYKSQILTLHHLDDQNKPLEHEELYSKIKSEIVKDIKETALFKNANNTFELHKAIENFQESLEAKQNIHDSTKTLTRIINFALHEVKEDLSTNFNTNTQKPKITMIAEFANTDTRKPQEQIHTGSPVAANDSIYSIEI